MADPIKLEIGAESITQLVKAKIEEELLVALSKNGGADALLRGLVNHALQAKVTRNYREQPFIADLVDQAIQEETRKAFVQWLTENRDTIRESMLAAIRKDKSLPVRILTNLLEGAANQYRLTIEVKPVKE